MRFFDENTGEKAVGIIEIMVVMAVSGILLLGIFGLFRNSLDIWQSSLSGYDVERQGRAALDEMTKFIRQAYSPVTKMYPPPGTAAREISFRYIRNEDSSGEMKYYKKENSLYRELDGRKSVVIDGALETIVFNHVSDYIVKIESMTLEKGSGKNRRTFSLQRTVQIRNE